jgi:hypothetical protein
MNALFFFFFFFFLSLLLSLVALARADSHSQRKLSYERATERKRAISLFSLSLSHSLSLLLSLFYLSFNSLITTVSSLPLPIPNNRFQQRKNQKENVRPFFAAHSLRTPRPLSLPPPTRLEPRWTAPQPNHSATAGYPQLPGVRNLTVYYASHEFGTYNHGPILTHWNDAFYVSWCAIAVIRLGFHMCS